jgi:hypothetical protein
MLWICNVAKTFNKQLMILASGMACALEVNLLEGGNNVTTFPK